MNQFASKVNVLGTEYTITVSNEKQDKIMKGADGYTDKTTKRIVVLDKPEDNDLGDFDSYQRKVLRHEIIHAFLFESGLHGNANYSADGEHPEMMVDWFAVQFDKLEAAFIDSGAHKWAVRLRKED